MDVDDQFYEDFSSFLPSADDYNLDELDEILRCTDTQLDSSIDLGALVPPEAAEVPNFQIENLESSPPAEYNFNFNAAPADSTESFDNSPYDSQRTSSSSSNSAEEDNFNPDDFINFLNDDDFKMEVASPADSGHDASSHHRGTPSPTGSCNSSICSATSGIQSDVSSITSSQGFSASYNSIKQEIQQEFNADMECKDSSVLLPTATPKTTVQQLQTSTTTATVLPLTLPMLSLQSSAAAGAAPAKLQASATQVQASGLSLLPGTLIPVKTVPITSVTTIKAPTPVKIEPKLAPKITSMPAKLSSATTTTKTTTATLPVNSKPKTIFLSSNDFKALMQKLNTNGKGAKISGNISGQMPKIVMKTANGQVITPSKTATQLVPKSVLKSAVPLIIKQEPRSPPLQTLKAACSTKSVFARPPTAPPDINIYKGIVDERTMKKQQRMIKNRESASLSRKKKKEYVVSLESRINDLEKENITLKGDNNSLRSQLVAFAQTCNCKHNNISDFILNSLNINSTQDVITCINEQNQHVRIAPKPSVQKSIKQRMLSASVKKNVAVLFAMAFMVTLNVGGFQSYLARDAIENAALEAAAEESVAKPAPAAAAGRRGLLWVESDAEFNDSKLNRSKRETEMQVPPLHFLRPNRTETLTAAEQLKLDALPSTSGSKCPMNSNHTENLRLASNLHKWIGGNDYLNLSSTQHTKFARNHVGFKLKPDYFDMKTYDLPLQRPPSLAPSVAAASAPQKRKQHYFQRAELHDESSKHKKLDTPSTGNFKNSLDLFKPKINDEYMRLFKGIKRQDDTFYVLSFNMDHILLPASSYNKSSRPKMALMLPSGDPSINGDIVLMQIDCEVVNTTEVQLKSHMIPEKMRPTKFTANANDVANNDTGTPKASHARNPRPSENEKGTDDSASVRINHTAPKPFFIMRPNKQQAAAFKQPLQPQAQQRTSNASVTKIEILESNVTRNSTLYKRMRETVEFLP